jgi:hypothetical protein
LLEEKAQKSEAGQSAYFSVKRYIFKDIDAYHFHPKARDPHAYRSAFHAEP